MNKNFNQFFKKKLEESFLVKRRLDNQEFKKKKLQRVNIIKSSA